MKEITKHIKFLTITLLLIGSVSCVGWLDLEPENSLVKQEFWQKKEDVAAVVSAMYDASRECSRDLWIWGELRADMIVLSGSEFAGYNSIAKSDIQPSNGSIKWEKWYNAINLANTILVLAKDVLPLDETFDEKTEKAYEAEALFIRSKSYFDLVRIWKEVPLVIQASNTDTVSFSVSKNTESEIIKQIEIDLITAKETAYKNEYANVPEMFKGRANYHSINALLADVYLWSEQYEKCIATCDEIINSGKFQLQSSMEWFNLYYPGNAPESIYEIQFNDTYEFEENPFNVSMVPPVGGTKVSLTPKARELYNVTDIRQGKPNPLSKYQYKSITSPRVKRTSAERDANMIYYRFADILLNKAEALAELGNFSESIVYINQILERALQPTLTIGADITTFRNVILDQRAKEFSLEGKRWFDILRFAKRNDFENKQLIIQMVLTNADVKQKPILRSKILDTMSYYLPIPTSELDR
jgi:tetratricopeptide (TPR) repeat protein